MPSNDKGTNDEDVGSFFQIGFVGSIRDGRTLLLLLVGVGRGADMSLLGKGEVDHSLFQRFEYSFVGISHPGRKIMSAGLSNYSFAVL